MKLVVLITIFIGYTFSANAECSRHFDPANSIVTTQGNCLPYNPNRESVDYLYSSFPLVTISSKAENYNVKALPLGFAKWTDFSGSEVIESSVKSTDSLEYVSNANGYLVTRVKKYAGGLGVALVDNNMASSSSYTQISDSWKAIGINFTKGSYTVYKLLAENKRALKSIKKKQKLPYSLERLEKWSVGDSVSFEVNGTVLVGLNYAVASIPVGGTAVITGAYQIYVQKIDESKLIVEVSRSKFKSLSLSTGAYFTNSSLSKFKKVGEGFSYEIDLRDEAVMKAYQKMFWGDFSALQSLEDDSDNVVLRKARDSVLKGRAVNLSASTPFLPLLYFNYSKGFFQEISNKVEVDAGKTVKQNYSIYSSATDAEAFKKVRFASKSFYAGIASDGVDTDKIAMFKWSYESNYATRKKLTRAISRLQKKTGLEKFFSVKVPKRKGDLKYAKVEMDFRLSPEFIDVISSSKNIITYKKLSQRAYNRLNSFCANKGKRCLVDGKRSLDTAMIGVKKQLRRIRKYHLTNTRQYLKAFSKFGSLIYKSPYLFESLYFLSKECGGHLRYVISGETFYRFEKQKNTFASLSCK